MNTLWRIAKDGLKAFAFWFVASVVMIYFLHDFGKLLSYALGIIFIVSFFVVRLIEFLGWVMRPSQSAPKPPVWAPSASGPSAPVTQATPQYCPKCGSPWTPGTQTCPNCG